MTERLDKLAEKAVAAYLRRTAKSHLELAIGAALRSHSIKEVREMLIAQANHLEEFG